MVGVRIIVEFFIIVYTCNCSVLMAVYMSLVKAYLFVIEHEHKLRYISGTTILAALPSRANACFWMVQSRE